MISNLFVPVMAPIGLGDWRICTALFSGFIAKESVVSTMEILFSQSVENTITAAAAASILVFSLLYTPCIAAISSIKREMGMKWAAAVMIWQCAVAWLAAFMVYSCFGFFS